MALHRRLNLRGHRGEDVVSKSARPKWPNELVELTLAHVEWAPVEVGGPDGRQGSGLPIDVNLPQSLRGELCAVSITDQVVERIAGVP